MYYIVLTWTKISECGFLITQIFYVSAFFNSRHKKIKNEDLGDFEFRNLFSFSFLIDSIKATIFKMLKLFI